VTDRRATVPWILRTTMMGILFGVVLFVAYVLLAML
jgi:hypothetical protein